MQRVHIVSIEDDGYGFRTNYTSSTPNGLFIYSPSNYIHRYNLGEAYYSIRRFLCLTKLSCSFLEINIVALERLKVIQDSYGDVW